MIKSLFNKSILSIWLCAGILACSKGLNVQSTHFSNADFTGFSAFKFYNPANIPKSNFSFSKEDQTSIFEAIASEMKKRGFESRADANLIIKVQGGTKKVDVQDIQNRQPYSYNYSYYNRNYYEQDVDSEHTTLIIDMFNDQSKELIWQGVASGELSENELEADKMMQEAVKKIFEEFPVPTKINQ